MKTTLLVTAVVISAVLAGTSPAAASNAIAKAEGLVCTTCHDKPGSKLLTDQGKYYDLMSSLDGYAEIHETFGKCTSCHVRKPGSLKLTKEGRRFQWMINDMEGLRELVLGYHPEAAAPAPAEMEGGESGTEAPPVHRR